MAKDPKGGRLLLTGIAYVEGEVYTTLRHGRSSRPVLQLLLGSGHKQNKVKCCHRRIHCEAPRPQGGASRARSGERLASKGNFVHIVPLDPAYKAGLVGHVPVKKVPYSFRKKN